jgi:hypothetical protein
MQTMSFLNQHNNGVGIMKSEYSYLVKWND